MQIDCEVEIKYENEKNRLKWDIEEHRQIKTERRLKKSASDKKW